MLTMQEFLGKAKGLFAGVEKIEGINTALTDAQAEIVSLKDQLAKKDTALTEANKTIDGLKAAASTKEQEHKQTVEAKDKEVEQKASAKAGAIVEQIGVPPVTAEKTAAQQSSKEDIQAQFAAMPRGKARSEFYQKHREILR